MEQSRYDFVSVSPSRTGFTASHVDPPTINWSNILLSAILGMATIGTGGVATAMTGQPISQTSGIAVKVYQGPRGRSQDEGPLLPEEQINAIRRYLSLNISDLAMALRVARPTVYAWLRDEAEPHGSNLARIQQLYRMARVWRAFSEQPVGPFLKSANEDGLTLVNLLSEEVIDEAAVRRAFEQIRIAIAPKRQSIAEMARSRGLTPVTRGVRKWTDDTLLND